MDFDLHNTNVEFLKDVGEIKKEKMCRHIILKCFCKQWTILPPFTVHNLEGSTRYRHKDKARESSQVPYSCTGVPGDFCKIL